MQSGHIRERLCALPLSPGVYLFKDSRERIIYVGKASRLRNRIRSYFTSRAASSSPKLSSLVEHIADFEFYVTASEEEALVLELNLIKRFRPQYNISLKDDKTFPYLKIEPAGGFPRIVVTRRVMQDGGRYFGPFAGAGSVRIVLHLIKRIFPFRSCTRDINGKDSRACLDYHIGRCLGPCIGAASKEEYGHLIKQVALFLEGKTDAVLRELRRDMDRAAGQLQYEKAAVLRDQIRAVEQVVEEQRIATTVKGEQDVIALARAGDICSVQVFFIRDNKLIGRESFTMDGTRDELPGGVMASFLKQFYGSATSIPPFLLVQHQPEDSRTIQQWLSRRRGSKTRLIVPQRGARKRLVDMVAENAMQELEQRRVSDMSASETIQKALQGLKDMLHLPTWPQRVECYDISDIVGLSAVGSMVVFHDGKPLRSHYRRFRIKGISGADDYAMMQQVLRRRFNRYNDRNGSSVEVWGSVPDLVLIDGGKGHLALAAKALQEAGAGSVPVASIAKEREEIFLPGTTEPLVLPAGSAVLHLLQRIRDEAHRFAITYHRKVRSKEAKVSMLDSIPGIGPRRRKALLERFGSVDAIRAAALDEIASVRTMTKPTAERLKHYLCNCQ
ncbi:MAG: excinuclease ABC subunit UvrC [Chloroflexi bacterium]|nr:excinuclease ABC subunit UvrC [Chloroflexota bacterium]